MPKVLQTTPAENPPEPDAIEKRLVYNCKERIGYRHLFSLHISNHQAPERFLFCSLTRLNPAMEYE